MLRLVTEVQPAGMTEAHQGSPGGCVSKFRPSWGNSTQGCLLRVQMWAVGRSQEVSSRVPPRTLRTVEPGRGAVQTHMPHSGHIQRVDTRPLPVVRWTVESARRSGSIGRFGVAVFYPPLSMPF